MWRLNRRIKIVFSVLIQVLIARPSSRSRRLRWSRDNSNWNFPAIKSSSDLFLSCIPTYFYYPIKVCRDGSRKNFVDLFGSLLVVYYHDYYNEWFFIDSQYILYFDNNFFLYQFFPYVKCSIINISHLSILVLYFWEIFWSHQENSRLHEIFQLFPWKFQYISCTSTFIGFDRIFENGMKLSTSEFQGFKNNSIVGLVRGWISRYWSE